MTWLWIVVGVVFDQLLKLGIVSALSVGESWPIFQGFTLTLLLNKGVAFGAFSGSSGIVFWILNAVIVLFNWILIECLHASSEHQSSWYRGALMLVITGGVSNLIDRVCYGAVVDYIALNFAGMNWPTVFNLADVFITLGCVTLCLLHSRVSNLESKPIEQA